MRRPFPVLITACFLSVVSVPGIVAEYQVPPQPLIDIVDAPRTPFVSVSPDRQYLLLQERPGLPGIEELAEPELRLAGLRINPATNGPSRGRHLAGLTLLRMVDRKQVPVTGLPENPRIRSVEWSPDGQHIAFTLTLPDRIELWVADRTGLARRLIDNPVNAALGTPFEWLPYGRSLLVRVVPEGRGPVPVEPVVPAGPVIQEATGKTAAARTYQDLLEDSHDEALFEHYATSQVLLVALDGDSEALRAPAIIDRLSPSPDGRFILAEKVHRPYSYLVPVYRFPTLIEVWDRRGNVAYTVADLPLAEDVPIGRDAARTGPRSVGWRSDADATLVWVEAQDGGDPRAEAEVRDRVYAHTVPTRMAPKPIADLELRYGGIIWGEGGLALLSERWWTSRRARTWKLDLEGGNAPDLLFDRSYEDRYNDPGDPITERDERGRRLLVTSNGGDTIYLRGAGASPEGDQPFLDAYDLRTKEAERLWQSEAPYYEGFLAFLGASPEDGWLIRRESVTEPANYFARGSQGQLTALTNFPHPYPQLADVEKEIIRYQRHDGTDLTATLYLPSGYRPSDGPLRMLMWAYPREFKSADAAGQMRGSPYTFSRVSPNGPLPFLAMGYAVLDGPTMPIVGEGDTEPNDRYVEQLVASAQAAVDEVVRRGVAYVDGIAIGGHSYGAFMTGNLLAHSDIFAAGIARSGAYNRTLTPFGFQAEERTYWEAPEVYFAMSPFMHADEVDEPILLIHGEADNNSGTFPMQSERFFNALKGHGATARLVMLPYESHGYAARESVLHMLYETNAWLETHLGKPPAKDSVTSVGGSSSP